MPVPHQNCTVTPKLEKPLRKKQKTVYICMSADILTSRDKLNTENVIVE